MHLALREDAAENARLCVRALTAVSEFSLWKQLPCKICPHLWCQPACGCGWAFSQMLALRFVFENLAFGVYSSFRHDIFQDCTWNLQWIFSLKQNPNTTLAVGVDLVC